jgi:hypothetical protein
MINAFKSIISKRGGLSKANRFDVLINLPPNIGSDDRGRDLSLLCESAQLPGKQITTLEWSLYGHNIKVPTNFIQEDATLVFNITNDYYAKRIFDIWQNRVISDVSYLLAYDSEFKVDILIRQLDEEDKIVYTTQLMRAYPISVQAIALDNNAESQTQKLSVVFAYDNFKQF